MPHVRQRGNEHCPVIQRCLPLAVDSMRSVHQATRGENAERWYAHAPLLFRCIPVNGLVPMQAEAMATIKENWPRRFGLSRPICGSLLSLQRLLWFVLMGNMVTR